MDYNQARTLSAQRLTKALVSALKKELRENPNREYSDMDAKIMSRSFYEKVAEVFKKEQAEKDAMARYNKAIGRSKRRR